MSQTDPAPPMADEQIPYRALSPLAVSTFVLGLFSVLVLAWDFAKVIPVAAMLLGVSALRQLKRDDALAGRRLAVWGMSLGAGLLVLVLGVELLTLLRDRSVVVKRTAAFVALINAGREDEAMLLAEEKRRPRPNDPSMVGPSLNTPGPESGSPFPGAIKFLGEQKPLGAPTLIAITRRGNVAVGTLNRWTIAADLRVRGKADELVLAVELVKADGWQFHDMNVKSYRTYLLANEARELKRDDDGMEFVTDRSVLIETGRTLLEHAVAKRLAEAKAMFVKPDTDAIAKLAAGGTLSRLTVQAIAPRTRDAEGRKVLSGSLRAEMACGDLELRMAVVDRDGWRIATLEVAPDQAEETQERKAPATQ